MVMFQLPHGAFFAQRVRCVSSSGRPSLPLGACFGYSVEALSGLLSLMRWTSWPGMLWQGREYLTKAAERVLRRAAQYLSSLQISIEKVVAQTTCEPTALGNNFRLCAPAFLE